MAGGGSTQDYSSLPVYDSQADVDYATRKGLLNNGDKVRIGNSIYELDREAGWSHRTTLPPGTFPTAAETAATGGILNPLPTGTPVTGGITATGGITDPNYKALGEYLVGPTYTGPTTADEYVMQRAGGPAWDYAYPMYLGAGGYGPGNRIPTVDSTGNWIVDGVGDTTTDSITTADITDITDTTDTTDTTTTESETDEMRTGDPFINTGWGPGQMPPVFSGSSPFGGAGGRGPAMYENWVSAGSPGSKVPQADRMTPQQIEAYMAGTDGPTVVPAGTIDWSPMSTTPSGYIADPNWSGWAGQKTHGLGSSLGRLSRGLETKNMENILGRIDIAGDDYMQDLSTPDYGAGLLSGSQPSVGSYEMDAAPIATQPVQHTGINQAQFEAVTQPVSTSQIKQNQMAVAVQQQQAIQQQQAQQAAAAERIRQDQISQAQAVIGRAAGRDRGVDQRELAAAMEVMSQVDTFGQAGGLLGNFESEQDRMAQDRASVAMDRGDSRSYGPQ